MSSQAGYNLGLLIVGMGLVTFLAAYGGYAYWGWSPAVTGTTTSVETSTSQQQTSTTATSTSIQTTTTSTGTSTTLSTSLPYNYYWGPYPGYCMTHQWQKNCQPFAWMDQAIPLSPTLPQINRWMATLILIGVALVYYYRNKH